MPALPTKIVTDLEPDDAHVQTAGRPFDAQDRQYIDTQIRGCQQHLSDLLINGIIGTWARVASSSAALAAGDVVCLAGVASGEPTVTLATAAAIAGPGAAYGVVLVAAAPGARVQLAIDGILPPSITGLATTAGNVRVSSVGRAERVASFSTGDYPLGAVNAQGYLTLTRSTAVGAAGSASPEDVDPTPNTLALRGSSGEVRAARVELADVRIVSGAPEQLGDLGIDPTTGEPYAYIDGRGVVALREWVVRVPRLKADDAELDDMPDVPICGPPGVPWTITAARYIANETVPAHANDYVQLAVRIYTSVGGTESYAAIGNTKPSGTNSVGTINGFIPWSLVLQPGLEFPIDPSHYMALSIAKFNGGKILPAGVFEVVCRPWRDA